jgi:hypothetical protein
MLTLLMFGLFIVLLFVLEWDPVLLVMVSDVGWGWLWVCLLDGVDSRIWGVEFGRAVRPRLPIVCKLWLLTGSEGALPWGKL